MSLPEDETQIRQAVPEGSQILTIFDNVSGSNGQLSEGREAFTAPASNLESVQVPVRTSMRRLESYFAPICKETSQRMTFDESGQGALGSADESCSVMETGSDPDASDREVCTFLSTVSVEVPNEQTSNQSRLGAVAASSNVFLKRPSASAIWDYFRKDRVTGKSQCRYCQIFLTSINATNAKRHLKSCKPSEYDMVVLKDSKISDSENVKQPKQKKLEFGTSYPRNHPKQMVLRKKLAMLYGCTSISGNDFRKTLALTRDQIKAMLKDVKRMTIGSDIWTKKGNRSSYLSVTATFFIRR
ncbi:unnamed protein product [Allacma fusca]|uniref:BED-type domain-containing protein n=1 Tax=Allacma fusca TaxID=39272 RepID=A0A8J2NSU2_9HEXA|nr:unnamed protein product [Allacma fusca]